MAGGRGSIWGYSMPVQRVRIGPVTVESGDLPWDAIKQVSRWLREFFRWDPRERTWSATWRVFARLDQALKVCDRIAYHDARYASELKSALVRVASKVPPYIVEGDAVVIPLISVDPIAVSRQLRAAGFDFTLSRTSIHVDGAELELACVRMSKKAISALRKRLKELELPEAFVRAVMQAPVEELVAQIKPRDKKTIEVFLPPDVSDEVVEQICELGVIRYRERRLSKEEEERVISLVEVERTAEGTYIYLPSYAGVFAKRILKRHGIPHKAELGIPESQFECSPKIKLYDFQQEALSAWLANEKLGTIVLPTGSGKTFVAMAAMAQLRVPTVVFVPNTMLLDQWVEKIAEWLGVRRSLIGKFGGGERVIRTITIATYQSGSKYIEELADKFAFVVFDEAHHVPARTFVKVALYLRAPFRMALSATPKRADGNESLLFKLSGNVVYAVQYSDLVRRGLLTPFIIRRILVPLPAHLALEYRRAEEMANNASDDVERARWISKALRIASDNPIKIEVIKKLVQRHRNEKIFIFCGSIAFAQQVYTAIRNLVRAALLTSQVSKDREEMLRKAFERGAITCLVLVHKAEEGVDLPDASVAIIAGGSKQQREFIQRIGRVLRRAPGKKLAYIYELVTDGTIERAIANARGARSLAREIEDIVYRRFGVPAFSVLVYGRDF